MFKSHTGRGFFICVVVTLAVLVVFFTRFLTALEYKTIDLRFDWVGPQVVCNIH
jgi:uncharacterized membrane protein